MEDDGLGVSFHVNWVSVVVFLVLSVAVALYARRVSGGWTRRWLGLTPVWWFVLLVVLPPVGVPLLAVSLFVNRRTPGAITGRDAAG